MMPSASPTACGGTCVAGRGMSEVGPGWRASCVFIPQTLGTARAADEVCQGPDNTSGARTTHRADRTTPHHPNISIIPTMVRATISTSRGTWRRTATEGSRSRSAMSWLTMTAETCPETMKKT